MTREIELRCLVGEPEEMADLRRVLERTPTYAHLVTGVPPGRADAESLCSILPEGRNYEDKFVYGVYADEEMVGCADIIRGYPALGTAYIGLLLIREDRQGSGIGRVAFEGIEQVIRSWGDCMTIRIAVVQTNDRVIPFWTKMGFLPTGETEPYSYGAVNSEAIILTKCLG